MRWLRLDRKMNEKNKKKLTRKERKKKNITIERFHKDEHFPLGSTLAEGK